MPDLKKALHDQFQPNQRYEFFGETIAEITVKGVRCHDNTSIKITNPITAFSGLNGTGKSTILQLAAIAYQNPDRRKSYFIKDFMPIGVLDPTPFKDDASVTFKYTTPTATLKTRSLTFHVTTQRKRWKGYDIRPEKNVFFGNVGFYLIKSEYSDFIFRHAGNLEISRTTSIEQRVKTWTARILGQNYDAIDKNLVTFSTREKDVLSVRRGGIQYSEPHMGYGEVRLQYLIDSIESMPEKSLILIEEPEISLHPAAQHEFGNYLLDLAHYKKHQILITTHSEYILETLPSESRIYLNKNETGIQPLPGLTAIEAKSLMTEAYFKALTVLVEDKMAVAVLSELLRYFDPDFHRTIGIYVGGSDSTIKSTISTLSSTPIKIVGVLDGDQNPHSTSPPFIFYLPGSLPPEKELLTNLNVKEFLMRKYRVDFDSFHASKLNGIDHHNWFGLLSEYVNQNIDALMYELAEEYAHSFSSGEIAPLITQLKESIR